MAETVQIPTGNRVAPLTVRDRRTKESRRLESSYADFVAQLGPAAVSPAIAALVTRAAALQMHLEQLDGRMLDIQQRLKDRGLGKEERASLAEEYARLVDSNIRMSGALARVMRSLGLKAAPADGALNPHVAVLARRRVKVAP